MAGRICNPARMMATTTEKNKQRFQSPDLAAVFITLLGFLIRLWTAFGTFLNPDEALHFRLANQLSLALAYKASLTASHPPLLTLVLYFWRASERRNFGCACLPCLPGRFFVGCFTNG